MSLSEPMQVALEVAQVLENLSIPHYLGGSLASSLFGLPRTTQDIDLVADMNKAHVEPFEERLKDRYYVEPQMILNAIRHYSCFNIIHSKWLFKVDIFIAKPSHHSREEMERRQREPIGEEGDSLYVASPEDIILEKLIWYEKGDRISERQWRDVLGVIQVQKTRLDREYLKKWAVELGVEELLERIWQEG